MSTYCETITEALPQNEVKQQLILTPKKDLCPPGCQACKKENNARSMKILFNAIGILFAILAAYMIISTDSKMYFVFWIGYSILRRMMMKSKKHLKTD